MLMRRPLGTAEWWELAVSVPPWTYRERGRGTQGWTSCQEPILNPLCQCNEASLKIQKDRVQRASGCGDLWRGRGSSCTFPGFVSLYLAVVQERTSKSVESFIRIHLRQVLRTCLEGKISADWERLWRMAVLQFLLIYLESKEKM